MIIDQQRKYHYEKAIYQLIKPNLDLKIGQHSNALDEVLIDNNAYEWCIITAYNPLGQISDNQANKISHLKLINQVAALQKRWIACRNLDPLNKWPEEPGLLILDFSKIQAIELAKRFNQKALVYGQLGNRPELLWTGL